MSGSESRRALSLWLKDGAFPTPMDENSAQECLSEALQQGLIGLLHAAQGDWPAAARERLASLHRTLVFREEQQLACARRVFQALAAAGVHALPLKGLALSRRFYDGPGQRPMADIDVLVLGRWTPALRAVQALGLRPLERADHARTFEDTGSRTVLELHHSVTSCPGLFPMDGERLWARANPQPDEPDAREPSPEDLLVHLSLHAAFQHGLVLSLVQLLDFRRVLERSGLDLALLRRLAAEAKAEVAVSAALRVAEAVVGAPLSGDLGAAFPAPRWLEPLSYVAPAVPALVPMRWRLARGRRFQLLLRTLAPTEPEDPTPRVALPFRAAARGARLAWRWLR